MSAFLSPIINTQIFTDIGVPNTGGFIYTYVAGTTTPQATWTTSLQTVPNANPIVLNAYGRPSQEIWLQGGILYKFVMTDQYGNPLTPSTYDNIDGINDVTTSVNTSEWIAGTTPTYLSATSFSVVGNQTATYSVGREVQAQVLAGTVYGTVSSSVYSSPSTTVTLIMAGTSALDSGLSTLSYGIVSLASAPSIFGNTPIALPSASIVAVGASPTTSITLTGVVPITSLGTSPSGTIRFITTQSALQFTNSASLSLFGGVNLNTLAGDIVTFESLGSGNWIATNYQSFQGVVSPQSFATSSVRQTVLSGPVDTSGNPTFLPATSGLSITTQNISSSVPLVVTAAQGAGVGGSVNVVGLSTTNLTWPVVTAASAGTTTCTTSGAITTLSAIASASTPIAGQMITASADFSPDTYVISVGGSTGAWTVVLNCVPLSTGTGKSITFNNVTFLPVQVLNAILTPNATQTCTTNGTTAITAITGTVAPIVGQLITADNINFGPNTYITVSGGTTGAWTATLGTSALSTGTLNNIVMNAVNPLPNPGSGGVLLPQAPTLLVPIYQMGGTPAVTLGQYTFNVSQMIMYLGNGTTAVPVNHVIVGEVYSVATIVGSVGYAYSGRFVSSDTTWPVASTPTVVNSGLGLTLTNPGIIEAVCQAADGGYHFGDVVIPLAEISGTTPTQMQTIKRRVTTKFTTGNVTPPINFINSTTGAAYTATAASWKYRLSISRGW
jgi:hypothetical protein